MAAQSRRGRRDRVAANPAPPKEMVESAGLVMLSRQEAEMLVNVLGEMPAKQTFGALTVLVLRISQADTRVKEMEARVRESAQARPAPQKTEAEDDGDEE